MVRYERGCYMQSLTHGAPLGRDQARRLTCIAAYFFESLPPLPLRLAALGDACASMEVVGTPDGARAGEFGPDLDTIRSLRWYTTHGGELAGRRRRAAASKAWDEG